MSYNFFDNSFGQISGFLSEYENDELNVTKVPKDDQYLQSIHQLEQKCDAIQKENERLVYRLNFSKLESRRYRRDVTTLKERLDLYNDNWRTAQPEPSHQKLNQIMIRRTINTNSGTLKASTNATLFKKTLSSGTLTGTKLLKFEEHAHPLQQQQEHNLLVTASSQGKRNRAKGNKGKNSYAATRPANKFFKFSQEQRSIVMDQLTNELEPGESEPSKQELTRQLARRLRLLNADDNMYETSNQKYSENAPSSLKKKSRTNPSNSWFI